MAVNDLYQLTSVQTYLGQQVLNVFVYKCVGIGTSTDLPGSLRDVFRTFIRDFCNAIQSDQLEYVGQVIVNLDDDAEFGVFSDSTLGADGGDGLPPYACYSFRLNRTTRAVRNGQKRIGGVPETRQANGVPTAAALTQLNLIAGSLGTILVEPITGASFEPRILHRATIAGVGGATATTPRADYAISNAVFTGISTQNTRKFGHGA